jgi:hypothetical protein
VTWVRRNATCPICGAPIGAVEMAENSFFIVEQQRESEDDDDDEHDEEEGDYREDEELLEADEDFDWYGWEGADEQLEGDDEGEQLVVEYYL